MIRLCFILVFTILSTVKIAAQTEMPMDTADYEQVLKERISKSHLNGFYIPKDVLDAMATMDEVMSPEAQKRYAYEPEDQITKKVFFSLGTWMGLNWGLYEGSRLSAWFYQQGIKNSDDMIWILLRTYHRHANGQVLDTEGLITEYIKSRENKKKEK